MRACCTPLRLLQLYVVSKSNPLPITIEDLARSKAEATEKANPPPHAEAGATQTAAIFSFGT